MVAYGTVAYFTYEETATNVITAGNVHVKLEELSVPYLGADPVPFADAYDVLPGTSVSKIVQVKNTGGSTAWIRITLDKEIMLADSKRGVIDLSLVTYEINDEYWVERDGWYYYIKSLAPGETTEPIIREVNFAASMGNLYQNSKALIHVTAHATQTANNGLNVFEAAGWPAEN